MPKKCKMCNEVKDFTAFDREEGGKKYQAECRQCQAEETAVAVGLSTETPPLAKKTTFNAERQRRIDRYRLLKQQASQS